MVKKFLRGVFTAVIVLAVIWAAMAVTDYLRCRLLKEPVFVRPIISDDSGEGVFGGIGYHIMIYRDPEQGNAITETSYSLFGSGIMKAELIDGEIYVKNLNWLSTFFD